ncbi:MAG: OmpA family protein [Hyphomicrobiaceae bacterium]|nr:OmpA family protein [Hyphomicrobiaceae bacterium]
MTRHRRRLKVCVRKELRLRAVAALIGAVVLALACHAAVPSASAFARPAALDGARLDGANLRQGHAVLRVAQAEPQRRMPPTAAPLRPTWPSPRELQAMELYADALTELERGSIVAARRIFALIVQRYPDSEEARRAKSILGRLDQARQGRPMPSEGLKPGKTPALPAVALQRLRMLMAEFKLNVGDRVFFSEGHAALGAKARVVLTRQARWLQQNRSIRIVVVGHADERGSEDLNHSLSLQRAEEVRKRLISEGVAAERIDVRAEGKRRPVAICQSQACASQNRRVETKIVAPGLKSDDGRHLSRR